ncbi:MAG: hypothetical protein ABSF43_00815 [Rectinemataceae bacterium]|jgi:hypothetical protein
MMRELGLNKRATNFRKRRGSRGPARGSGTSLGARTGSGLIRATQLRVRLGLRTADVAVPTGISSEDQKEIQDEIDEVSRSNRISTRPEDFVVRPRRNGFVFPLVVNLLAIAATVTAVLLLSFLFRQRDIAIANSSSALDTAEGKLLQELKRDSDSKLLEKDKAIADIRTRLVSLDKERNDLAANIDEKVRTREVEFRSKLQEELEAEKKRLADQGLSSAALQARFKSYEAEKTVALDKQLADARKSAEAEKNAADDKFKLLKEEYNKNMAGLGEERKRIQDESKKREDALKATLEAKNKELETQSATATEGLEKARSELAGLEAQKAKAKAEDDRVVGLYGTIRLAIRDRRYAAAAAGADALASFLEDPNLLSDPAIRDRRDADLFVAETLGIYARSELERASADAGKLLAQADLLAAARDATAAAQAALKAGDTALASAKYGEALSKVPEILAAHEYFLDQLKAAETIRRARLDEALSSADRAYKSDDPATYAARYSEALSYLPIKDAARNTLIARFGQLAIGEAEKNRNAADTKAARPLLAAATSRLEARDWSAAIAGYIGILASYPAADQCVDALKGIDAARDGMQKSADASAAGSAADAAAARKALADAQARTAQTLASAHDTEALLRSDIESLKKQLVEAQAKTAQAASEANPTIDEAAQAAQAGKLAELNAEAERLRDELAANAGDAGKYREGAAKYEILTSSYKRYLESEAEAMRKGGQGASLAAQSSLYTFLGDRGVAEAFPGLRDKVTAFQGATQSELLDAFPSDASEIVQQALTYKDKAALRAYYASKREVYEKSGNKLMVNFLDAVSKVVN